MKRGIVSVKLPRLAALMLAASLLAGFAAVGGAERPPGFSSNLFKSPNHIFSHGDAVPASVEAASITDTPEIDFAVVDQKRARLNWQLNCQGCHGAKAEGSNAGAPAMPGVLGRLLAIKGGREYLVQVPGVAAAPLTDAEIADLMNWMLEKFDRTNIPGDFIPYKTAEVRELRKDVLFTTAQSVRESLLADSQE